MGLKLVGLSMMIMTAMIMTALGGGLSGGKALALRVLGNKNKVLLSCYT